MTLWLADHHTINTDGNEELVITPREVNTPVLAATRQIGQANNRKYQAGAMMMKNMYDRSEWQMLSHPSCVERSMLQAA